MSLDKQRILNELGSVMNQLQSADCGCMENIFSGSGHGACNPTGNPLPTCGGCRRGCCRGHGYGVHYNNGGGEPYSMNSGGMHGGGMHGGGMLGGGMHGGGMHAGGMHGGAMPGDDMSGGMHGGDMSGGMPGGDMHGGGMHGGGMHGGGMYGGGMSAGGMSGGVSGGGMSGGMHGGGMSSGGMPGGGMGGGQDPSAHMGGMGAQIANMMMSGGGGRPTSMPSNAGQGGHLTEPMLIDAPNSPHGQVGVMPLTSGRGNMQGHPNPGTSQDRPGGMMQQPTTQYVTQDKVYAANAVPQGNTMAPPTQQGMPGNATPMMPQMGSGMSNPYGQHTAGMNKFKEMFPGAIKEDLNFDPMAIAIQMNPANQKKAAMDTMNKLMSGNRGMGTTQPASQSNAAPPEQAAPLTPQTIATTGQQQIASPGTLIPPQQQQIYTATGAPNQGFTQQQIQGQENQQGQLIDPNTGAVISPDQARAGMVPQETPYPPGQEIKEPIYPVDASKNNTVGYVQPQYTYNTLGQPVELLNPKLYEQNEPYSLQQTLFGGLGRDARVKNTMSKTSLAGNRPLGTKASRSQLQHIYRQYKASQSATQQSIRPPPVQGGSLSEGHLYTPHSANPPVQQVPVEKVGGDTFANNPNVQMAKVEQANPGQVGDVPQPNSPQGDQQMVKSPGAEFKRTRNGLQDMTFTRYQTTKGWSFHG